MNKQASTGSSLPTTLLVVFVVLKLTGNIDWSWWWVLSPFWIPLVFAIILAIFGVILLKSDKPLTKWPRKD